MYLAGKLQPVTAKPAAARQDVAPAPAPDRSGRMFGVPTGRFYSEEAEVTYEVVAITEGLAIRRRPGIETRLRKISEDEYGLGGNTVRFIRNANGEVTEMSLRGSRVFDLRFKRVDPTR